MGVSFVILKRDKREMFELGKGSIESLRDSNAFKDTSNPLEMFKDIFNLFGNKFDKETGRGLFSWFQIGKSENYILFRLPEQWPDRAKFDACIDFCLPRYMRDGGQLIADRIWEWAGNDLICLADGDDYRDTAKELGFSASRYKVTGSVW